MLLSVFFLCAGRQVFALWQSANTFIVCIFARPFIVAACNPSSRQCNFVHRNCFIRCSCKHGRCPLRISQTNVSMINMHSVHFAGDRFLFESKCVCLFSTGTGQASNVRRSSIEWCDFGQINLLFSFCVRPESSLPASLCNYITSVYNSILIVRQHPCVRCDERSVTETEHRLYISSVAGAPPHDSISQMCFNYMILRVRFGHMQSV